MLPPYYGKWKTKKILLKKTRFNGPQFLSHSLFSFNIIIIIIHFLRNLSNFHLHGIIFQFPTSTNNNRYVLKDIYDIAEAGLETESKVFGLA